LAALAFMSTSAIADSPFINGGSVSMKSDSNLKNVTLTVSGPNGYQQTSRSTDGSPAVVLSDNGGAMADGIYTWQMTGHTGKRIVTAKNRMNNGRGDAQRAYSFESVSESGTFTIKNGVQVDSSLTEK